MIDATQAFSLQWLGLVIFGMVLAGAIEQWFLNRRRRK